MELSIIIPSKNEESRIGNTLRSTIDFCKEQGYDYEIIVVDDGCVDNTRGVVERFKDQGVWMTQKRPNRGKGFSVKEGMLKAKKEVAVFMDADNSTQISEVKNFLPLLGSYDIIIASRNLKGSVIATKQPKLRSILGNIFPFLVRLLVVRGVKDTQCGFKLFSKKAIMELFPRSRLNRWGFDVELLFIAKKRGLKVKEMPITWSNEGQSKVNPFKDSIDMFFDLIRIRFNSLRGRYR